MLPVTVAEQPIGQGFITLALIYEVLPGVAMTDDVVILLRVWSPVCGDSIQAHIGNVDHLVVSSELFRLEHHAILPGNKGQQVCQSEALVEPLTQFFFGHQSSSLLSASHIRHSVRSGNSSTQASPVLLSIPM